MPVPTSSLPSPEPASLAQAPRRVVAPLFPTLRGLAILAIVTYLIFFPVVESFDVVATILAATLGVMFTYFFLTTAIGGLLCRTSLKFTLNVPDSETISSDRPVSGKSVRLGLALSRIQLLIGHHLLMRVWGEHHRQPINPVLVTGGSRTTETIPLAVTFPHRGKWRFSSVTFEYGDVFGIALFRWQKPCSFTCTIYPPYVAHSSLPIISASEQIGDMLSDTQIRAGEPYDLKQYDPSEGTRRLLWKLFAKRRELVTRHPEAAMTPEGRVCVYVMARAEDDILCSHAEAYMRKLEELGLTVCCGCSGAPAETVALTTSEALSLMVSSSADADNALANRVSESAHQFIDATKAVAHLTNLHRAVVFIHANLLGNERGFNAAIECARAMRERGVEAVFVVVSQLSTQARNEPQLIEKIFLVNNRNTSVPSSRESLNKFLGVCASNNWEVVSATDSSEDMAA